MTGPASGDRAVRVDKWLWSVRVLRTRTAATEACGAGRVTVNGEQAKPATRVSVGDTVSARLRERTVVCVVEKLIDKRVSATLAAECYRDESPAPEPPPGSMMIPTPIASRDRGTGRPTKRDRRRMDQFRRRP